MSRRVCIIWALRLLAVVAAGVSLYLAVSSFTATPVVGCSGESAGCSEVLASRWSKWFGLPVAAFGGLTYLALLGCTFALGGQDQESGSPLAWVVSIALGLAAAGSAAWFIGVQLIAVGSLCPWCMAVHACGIITAILLLVLLLDVTRSEEANNNVFGADQVATDPVVSGKGFLSSLGLAGAAIAVLVVGQLLSSEPDSFRMEIAELPVVEPTEEASNQTEPAVAALETEAAEPSIEDEPLSQREYEPLAEREEDNDESVVTASAVEVSSRIVRLPNLDDTIDVYAHPSFGDPAAREVFVEFADYTCHHCRLMHEYLHAGVEAYPEELVVVVRLCALNRRCNRYVSVAPHSSKKYACDYAKLALAVWRSNPDLFPEFHDFLMDGEKPPTKRQAQNRAVELCGMDVLIEHFESDRVARMLDDNHRVFNDHREGGGLPRVFTSVSALSGVPKDKATWMRILEQIFAMSRDRAALGQAVDDSAAVQSLLGDKDALPGDPLSTGSSLLEPVGGDGSDGLESSRPRQELDTEFDDSLFE